MGHYERVDVDRGRQTTRVHAIARRRRRTFVCTIADFTTEPQSNPPELVLRSVDFSRAIVRSRTLSALYQAPTPPRKDCASGGNRIAVVLRMRVLVVTPNADLRRELAEQLSAVARVESCADFATARARLVDASFALVVTDIRLNGYNGLHLVHLVNNALLPTRCIVFSSCFDACLAAEVIAAGAFYEHGHRVAAAAPSYVGAALPERERRNPARVDQGANPRGGRRASDVPAPVVAI
jgi:CheY-like chemotaxis protein